MAADYDEVSIKSEVVWEMAVRSSRDDKIARTRTRIQKITKRRFVADERLVESMWGTGMSTKNGS
jgi:hypothetical protein